MQKTRWSTAIAAAALLALPVAGSAQSTTTPEQNPPAQQPPASTAQQPASPQTTQPPAAPTSTPQSASGQVDQTAAKAQLTAARDTLSQITSMPEATHLQGTARTQVSAVITDFNALITTPLDWRASYAKVDSDLTSILGPDNGNESVGTSGSATPAPTGTTGTTATADAPIDPAIRAKLVQFRAQLREFDRVASGSNAASSSAPAAAGAAMATSAATSSTSTSPNPENTNPTSPASPNPSNPAPASSSVSGEQTPPTGTSGVTNVNAASRADAQKELDAISAILDASKTGTLTSDQTANLKRHVEALRSLLSPQQ
ncbi:MAG TPA: hypothetical protein VGI12_05025 [Vicinamibacterales bacterium]